MNDEVAVIRGDGPLKGEFADVSPITESPPLEGRQPMGLAFISDLDVECQISFGLGVTGIVNLRQHFVVSDTLTNPIRSPSERSTSIR